MNPGDRAVYDTGRAPLPGAPDVWQARRAVPSMVVEAGPAPADPMSANVRLWLPGQRHGEGEWWANERDLRVIARAVYVEVPRVDPSALRGSTVALDFDGPVHSYRSGWTGFAATDPPTPGALTFVRTLLGAGARVVIHTSRADCAAGVKGVREFLGLHGFPELEVTYEKVPAAAYVDDRAVPFDPRVPDWPRVLADVARLCAVRHRGESYPDERTGVEDEASLARRLEGELLARLPHADDVDTESSASRQHFIDTGRYLRRGEGTG